ncbi:SKP1/ASK-interacting protein 16 [Euphorbia peplus]|nr:SKP1/ASK-interacting protein 16 [Euphorbia peplus]
MGLECVGDLGLNEIFSKIGPKQTAIVSCVSKRLKASASNEPLWSKFLLEDVQLSSPCDPQGHHFPSSKIAYALWREAFVMYPWPLVIRVKKCWDTINGWLAINFPEAGATLQQGASEAQIHQLEKALEVKLPLPTRVLYRFCDGQVFKESDSSTCSLGSLGNALGLIGGYAFYHHMVNVFLLPLNQVILETQQILRHLNMTGSGYIVVAASSAFIEKLFFLNCENGQLYVGRRNLRIDGEMMPCVPEALVSSVHESSSNLQQQDALLLWLEEHGRR